MLVLGYFSGLHILLLWSSWISSYIVFERVLKKHLYLPDENKKVWNKWWKESTSLYSRLCNHITLHVTAFSEQCWHTTKKSKIIPLKQNGRGLKSFFFIRRIYTMKQSKDQFLKMERLGIISRLLDKENFLHSEKWV